MADQQREPELRNVEETAAFFSVSVPTIRAWIRDGMPVRERGANGVAYRIDLRAAHAWRQERLEREREAEAEKRRRDAELQAELFGADQLAPSVERISPAEQAQLIAAELNATKLAEKRGELVRALDLQIELARLLRIVSNKLRAVPDDLARRFGWSDAETDQVQAAIDDMLHDLADQIENLTAVEAEPVEARTDAA